MARRAWTVIAAATAIIWGWRARRFTRSPEAVREPANLRLRRG